MVNILKLKEFYVTDYSVSLDMRFCDMQRLDVEKTMSIIIAFMSCQEC